MVICLFLLHTSMHSDTFSVWFESKYFYYFNEMNCKN